MTIVVFDGTQLVADSRCSTARGIRADNICKIHPLGKYNIKYSDKGRVETLNAITFSGSLSDSDEFLWSMFQYLREGGEYYGKIGTFTEWHHMKATFGIPLPNSTALLLTTDDKGKVHLRKLAAKSRPVEVKDFPVAIGSGRIAVGGYLMETPKITAMDITAMAIAEDLGCGGRMSIYNPTTGKLTLKEGLTEARKKQIAKLVSTHLLNTL